MRRIHAPELEDEAWFPCPLRDGHTDFLQALAERTRAFDAVAPLLRDALAESGARRIVELSRKLEELGRSGKVDEAPALLKELETTFSQTRAHLLPLRDH